MKRTLLAAATIAVALLLFSKCTSDQVEPKCAGVVCETDTLNFEHDVKPITTNYCAYSGCHSEASFEADLALETYTQVKAIADDGRLLCYVNGGCEPRMPYDEDPLPDSLIHVLECWVCNGTPE